MYMNRASRVLTYMYVKVVHSIVLQEQLIWYIHDIYCSTDWCAKPQQEAVQPGRLTRCVRELYLARTIGGAFKVFTPKKMVRPCLVTASSSRNQLCASSSQSRDAPRQAGQGTKTRNHARCAYNAVWPSGQVAKWPSGQVAKWVNAAGIYNAFPFSFEYTSYPSS